MFSYVFVSLVVAKNWIGWMAGQASCRTRDRGGGAAGTGAGRPELQNL